MQTLPVNFSMRLDFLDTKFYDKLSPGTICLFERKNYFT